MPSKGLSCSNGQFKLPVLRSEPASIDIADIESPIGPLRLRAKGDQLIGIEFYQPAEQPEMKVSPFLQEVARQLQGYFQNPKVCFSVPLPDNGTPFQLRVWNALKGIPAGETRTYGEIAAMVGGSPRSIGTACRANRVPLIIPCHRVVGRQGLTGYCGYRCGHIFDIKRWLLNHEGCRFG